MLFESSLNTFFDYFIQSKFILFQAIIIILDNFISVKVNFISSNNSFIK